MNELQYLADMVSLGIIALGMTFTTALLFIIASRLERIADRYRIKYGFDREIESKEASKEDTELKLDRRERNFKRRAFKD